MGTGAAAGLGVHGWRAGHGPSFLPPTAAAAPLLVACCCRERAAKGSDGSRSGWEVRAAGAFRKREREGGHVMAWQQ